MFHSQNHPHKALKQALTFAFAQRQLKQDILPQMMFLFLMYSNSFTNVKYQLLSFFKTTNTGSKTQNKLHKQITYLEKKCKII